jgi:hypothetical protein
MSERESLEMAKQGEVLSWSSYSEGDEVRKGTKESVQQDTAESGELTEFWVVWER